VWPPGSIQEDSAHCTNFRLKCISYILNKKTTKCQFSLMEFTNWDTPERCESRRKTSESNWRKFFL